MDHLFKIDKAEIVNEMLELFRFIADKYAPLNVLMPVNNLPVMQFLVEKMSALWNGLKTWSN